MTLLTNSDEVFTAFNLGPCAGCHAPVLLELLETQPEEHSYEDLFWPFSFVQRFGAVRITRKDILQTTVKESRKATLSNAP